MKLLALSLLGLGNANQVIQQTSEMSQHISSMSFVEMNEAKIVEGALEEQYKNDASKNSYIKGAVKAGRGVLARSKGECALHWSLCPNMCNVEYELKYRFEDIRGNKMTEYRDFKKTITDQRDAILHDLKGKASQIFDMEQDVDRNRADLEKLEDAFLIQLQTDYKQALQVNEGLQALKNSVVDIEANFVQLSGEIQAAHQDCEHQAPCMAVPICKLGSASGQSCADIVTTNIDKDDENSEKNHAASGVYLIKPSPGLPAKPTLCKTDPIGGAFTVIQNRFDGSLDFNRNWKEYARGFGQAVDLNSPACDVQEFWLGNEYIAALQGTAKNSLIIDMGRHNGQNSTVSYSEFYMGNARSDYQLQKLNGFQEMCGAKAGNAMAGTNFGDQGYNNNDAAKTNHIGMKFSTKDRDNDKNGGLSCAEQDQSGWWFNSCSAANLNGIYHGGPYSAKDTKTGEFDDGILWQTWTHNKFEALTRTQMSIGVSKGFMMCDAGAGDYVTDGGNDSTYGRGDEDYPSGSYSYYGYND